MNISYQYKNINIFNKIGKMHIFDNTDKYVGILIVFSSDDLLIFNAIRVIKVQMIVLAKG